MAGSSSRSSLAPRTKPHLPLVKCGSCGWRRVKVYTSTTVDHPNWDFYKCSNHQVGDTPCDFWEWEAEYMAYLKSIGVPIRFLKPGDECFMGTPEVENKSNVYVQKEKKQQGQPEDVRLLAKIDALCDVLKDIGLLVVLILLLEIIKLIKW
ncbi:hypothetical protein BRADI_1g37350v3 [Brachypodium distachyon]|uniref:GRF-type domain-containing protein n=1 Tax=Brachypodium distachyon TaxID=15368 RepID=I1GXT0_BRADI|nr:hypothetical protein BRADI_1g37350v3 [Brachypodium distachyon]